jgi:hypothetical protein
VTDFLYKCIVEMAKDLVTQTWPKNLKLCMSHHTVARAVAAVSGHVVGKLSGIVEKCCYFSVSIKPWTKPMSLNFLFLFVLSKVTFQLKNNFLICVH